MGAIPQLLLSKRTGESVLLIATGKFCSLFLRRASEQSGFKDSIRRMQCDHKPMMRSSSAAGCDLAHSLWCCQPVERREASLQFLGNSLELAVIARVFHAKRAGESVLLNMPRRSLQPFSPAGLRAVRFQRLHQANATSLSLGGRKYIQVFHFVAGCFCVVAMRWRVAARSASKRGSPCSDWKLSSFSRRSNSSTALMPSA
jgi:hypothetical protein